MQNKEKMIICISIIILIFSLYTCSKKEPIPKIKQTKTKKKIVKSNIPAKQLIKQPSLIEKKTKKPIIVTNINRVFLPKDVIELYQKESAQWGNPADIEPDIALMLYNNRKAIFIDVREKREQQISIIPGAIVISPETDLNTISSQINKKDILIIYCTIGNRSGKTAKELTEKGYHAYNLMGGIIGWTHVNGELIDSTGSLTKRVHTYGSKWNKVAFGYQSIY